MTSYRSSEESDIEQLVDGEDPQEFATTRTTTTTLATRTRSISRSRSPSIEVLSESEEESDVGKTFDFSAKLFVIHILRIIPDKLGAKRKD
jgi:hypothetical protein